MIAGIDFGSKKAGTTAIAFKYNDEICIIQSKKNQDADEFLLEHILDYNIDRVFIDAPLSLPGAYYKRGFDYHYRKCDRACGAMSPMFLGGLTARAIHLADKLKNLGVEAHETYPAFIVKQRFKEDKWYKKDIVLFLENHQFTSGMPCNWHQMDALLCLYAGEKFMHNQHMELGDPEEGIIVY